MDAGGAVEEPRLPGVDGAEQEARVPAEAKVDDVSFFSFGTPGNGFDAAERGRGKAEGYGLGFDSFRRVSRRVF